MRTGAKEGAGVDLQPLKSTVGEEQVQVQGEGREYSYRHVKGMVPYKPPGGDVV